MEQVKADIRILNAAVKVFAEKGYSATSTREIAAEAGVAEGTIFRYYKTKRDILLKALDKVVAVFSDENTLRPIEKIVADESSSEPGVVFKALLKDRIGVFRSNSDFIKVVFTEAQYSADISRKFYYALMTKLLPALLDFFNRGASEGSLRELSKEESMIALRQFLSIATGFVFQRNYAPNVIVTEEDKDIDILIDFFFNGLRK